MLALLISKYYHKRFDQTVSQMHLNKFVILWINELNTNRLLVLGVLLLRLRGLLGILVVLLRNPVCFGLILKDSDSSRFCREGHLRILFILGLPGVRNF